MILLIRNADDVGAAIEDANRFLVCQRQIAELREGGGVLGIWVRGELDEGLPAWCLFDDPLQEGARSNSPTEESDHRPGPREADLGVRWSCTLSGLWSLCWLDGTLLRDTMSATEHRRRILDALRSPAFASRFSRRPGKFFPVLGATEAGDSFDATVRQLQSDYPQLIDGTWFVDDPERGIVPPRRVEV